MYDGLFSYHSPSSDRPIGSPVSKQMYCPCIKENTKMRSKICAAIIIVLFYFPLVNIAGQAAVGNNSIDGNLVQNGDFEDVFKDQPTFWSKDAWMMDPSYTNILSDTTDPYSGKYSVTIENVISNDSRLVQSVEVKPNTVYLLSCYVKAFNTPANKVGANICASAVNRDYFNTSAHYEDTQGKWQYVELAVKTGAEQTALWVAIRLGGYGADTTGKASFDRFKLEEIRDPSGYNPRYLGTESAIESEKQSTNGFVFIAIVAIVLFIGIVAFVAFALVTKKKKNGNGGTSDTPESGSSEEEDVPLLLKKEKTLFTHTDLLVSAALTLIYAVIAFTNLGVMEAPETYWRPTARGETVTVDFGSPQLIRRIYYWQGLPGGHKPNESKYEVEGSLDGTNWTHITILNPKTICWWYFEQTSVRARYARVTVDVPGSWLNEVVFLGDDINNPIKIEKIIPGPKQMFTQGKVENLFDEYSDVGNVKRKKTLIYRPSIMTGMSPGFDEQYHGRTALEHLNFRFPYEDTHPPLGKLLIALGIIIFGMTPFGWRFMGTFFGVLMVPIMFAFGKRLFKKTEYAFMSAFLMMFDFMHFTQSRIATIDTYPVFFIILMYYFMYLYCEMSFITTDFRKMLLPLLLSGICWGLGAASKWIVIYAGAGLALIFFINLYNKHREVKELKNSKAAKKDKEAWAFLQKKIDEYPKRVWQTLGWSALVFIVLPALLYFLAYTPLMMVKEIGFNPGWVLESQKGMYQYHTELNATHSYSSEWFQWPSMIKPMAYYFADGLPEGQTQRLFAFGNPAIWWVGSLLAIVVGMIAFGFFIYRIYKESKEVTYKRGIPLTVLLIFTMAGNLAVSVFYFFFGAKLLPVLIPTYPGWTIMFICILCAANFRFAAAIWEWNRWGAYGLVISSIFVFVLNILGFDIVPALLGLVGVAAVIIALTPLWKNAMKSDTGFKFEMLKDNTRLFILIGLASQFFPWVISTRKLTFIYHFFASVPFIIFCIVYMIKLLKEKVLDPLKEQGESSLLFARRAGYAFIVVYLLIVLGLFIMFYPITAGVPAPTKYIQEWLKWLPMWYFA
jgi:dolichyl-phosphate-mannose-protein mannosyltransferase